ncbi:aspartate--tRNA ligase, partial [Candidatus Saccharibacteria bacterium]|nr:aspartate--tRNA ligase [Candidatus Saccharibacteria bacterium]
MNRTLSIEALDKIGQEITVKGWVNSRRDHGGLIFIDLRDHKGLIQLTIQPGSGEAFGTGEQLRDEFVISATGIVKERDENLKNPNIDTGSMEIIVSAIEVLNRSEPLPIQVNTTQNISEDNRLRYRYLDLRRPKMQSMLRRRSAYYEYIRRFMSDGGFTEVATPVLANSSPEGARDFLVP